MTLTFTTYLPARALYIRRLLIIFLLVMPGGVALTQAQDLPTQPGAPVVAPNPELDSANIHVAADSLPKIGDSSADRRRSAAGATENPGGGQGRRNNGGGQGSAAGVGHFYGKIVDAKTNRGVNAASVQLAIPVLDQATHRMKDSLIRGSYTQANGDFNFNGLPLRGTYKLLASAVGYSVIDQTVKFDLSLAQTNDPDMRVNAMEKDLGNIKMARDAQNLSEVTVTASKPLIQLGIDRKVYNVDKDIAASGGSAVDVMKNIPSLSVDLDGNVSLRNSSPTIFVDGRPTTLTLDQIPADDIESVEIISNPGAKYDASGGTSGILNVVLKKNRRAGYNGNLRAGADSRGGYNAGGNINVKEGKINVFLGGNFNRRRSISTGTTDRTTFITDPVNELHQYDRNVNTGYFAFGRAGIDYLIDNRNTLTVSGNLVHGEFKPTTNSDLTLDSLYQSGATGESFTHRSSNTTRTFNNQSGQLSFKHNFPRSGESLTADANYSNGKNSNSDLTTSTIYPTYPGDFYLYRLQQLGNGTNKYFTGQTDFVNPFSEKSKLEAGARIAVRDVSSLNNTNTIDDGGKVSFQPLLSSNYDYHDRVAAGYVTYTGAFGKKFGYQAGLRAESSSYHGTSTYAVVDGTTSGLKDTTGSFSNSYPISLFPSVYLSYKMTDKQEFQLNYTRRVDRPGFFQLFPYTDYSDSLNLSKGNPGLKPQFTHSVEMSYQNTYSGKNTFLASVYYKYTTDLITRYQGTQINPITGQNVLINTFINAKSSYVGGLELIGHNILTPWWELTSNINIYTSRINTVDSIETAKSNYSWFGKLNSTFTLSKHFSLQITGEYTSKTVLPPGGSASQGNGGGGRGGFGGTVSGNAQGYSRPTGDVDASLRYEFLKSKAASITLSCDDIFRTRVSDVFLNSQYSTQEAYRRRDPQRFRVQFRYRFGKFDVSMFKRKNNRESQDEPETGGAVGAQ